MKTLDTQNKDSLLKATEGVVETPWGRVALCHTSRKHRSWHVHKAECGLHSSCQCWGGEDRQGSGAHWTLTSLTLSVSWSSKKALCWHKPHRRTETPERKPHSYSHLHLITGFLLLFLIILLLLQLLFLLTVSKACIAGLGIGLVVDCFLSTHKAPGSIPSTAKAAEGGREAPQQTVLGKVDIHMQKNGTRFISLKKKLKNKTRSFVTKENRRTLQGPHTGKYFL